MIRGALVFLLATTGLHAAAPASPSFRNESSQSLIQMLARPYEDLPPELKNEEEPYYAICEILNQRREVDLLVSAYAQSTNATIHQYLASSVLYQISDPTVIRLFRSNLSEEETIEGYFIANYLAKLGDEKALAVLNHHYFQYPVSSLQWATTVTLFGQFQYRPATRNLIGSLDAASLNVVGAAIDSLKMLFPGTPATLKTIADYREYFLQRAAKESSLPR